MNPFRAAFSYLAFWGLGALTALTWSRAAEQSDLPNVESLMVRVERALVEAGYSKASGYGTLKPPGVFFAEDLPRGDWGWSVPGTVLLSRDQPAGCVRVTLAHELAHDATRRRDLLGADTTGAPVWAIKAEMELIADLVEAEVSSDGEWHPNCLMRRGIS